MKGCPSSSNVASGTWPFPAALSSSPRTRLTIREFLNVETYRFTASSARSSNVKNVVIFGALFPSLPLPCSLFFVISVSPFVLLPVSSGVARAPYRNERDVPPTGAGNRCAFVPLTVRPRSPPHAESADAGTRPNGPCLHLRGVGILLPEGHPGTRRILKHREPSLARYLPLRSDDFPAGLLDPFLVLVDRIHADVESDARLPVSGLQSSNASPRPARRLEEGVVQAGDFLEFPSEQASIELLDFLCFLDVELHVHDASRFRWFRHGDSSSARRSRAPYISTFGGVRGNYRGLVSPENPIGLQPRTALSRIPGHP